MPSRWAAERPGAYGPVDDGAQHVKALKVPRSPYDTASIIVTDTIEAMQAGIGNLPSGVCVPGTQNRTRKWSLQRVGWHRRRDKRYVMGGADASIWLTANGRTFSAWAKPAMWSPGTTSSRHGNAAHCRRVTSSSGSCAPM